MQGLSQMDKIENFVKLFDGILNNTGCALIHQSQVPGLPVLSLSVGMKGKSQASQAVVSQHRNHVQKIF